MPRTIDDYRRFFEEEKDRCIQEVKKLPVIPHFRRKTINDIKKTYGLSLRHLQTIEGHGWKIGNDFTFNPDYIENEDYRHNVILLKRCLSSMHEIVENYKKITSI